ncbi:hypothetical protein ACFFIW_05255, partial [Bifidobacterium apri]
MGMKATGLAVAERDALVFLVFLFVRWCCCLVVVVCCVVFWLVVGCFFDTPVFGWFSGGFGVCGVGLVCVVGGG